MKLELNKVYKDKEGNQWKTVLYKEGYARPFTAVNKAQDCDACYRENGLCTVNESERDLIELVGDDFKEEPMRIEFEGSVLYSGSTWNQETIIVAAHKKADFNFETAKSLQKLWSGVHNCKITIEEIIE
jgi:hypothetical protein